MDPRLPENRKRWAIGAGAAIVVVVLLVILLGGELSRDELIAKGDEICTEAHEAFRDLQGDPPRTAREAEDLSAQLAGIAGDERDEIADLDGPDDLDAQLERYVNARDEGIELIERGEEAAADSDPTAYQRAQAEVAASQLERLRIARQIGFRVCSKPLVGEAELARQAERPPPVDPNAPPTVSNPPGL